MRTPLLAACALTLTLASAHAQDVRPGFELTDRPWTAPILVDPFGGGFDVYGVVDHLTDGRYVSFDGLAVELHDAQGGALQTLGQLATPVFPSFVAVSPDEGVAVVGESTTGQLYRVDLVQGGLTPLANLWFNFDAAFEPAGDTLVVSAALGGFGTGNELVRVELATGRITPLAHVDGPSGPVAVDAFGNLYCGRIDPSFQPGLGRVYRWLVFDLDGSRLLDEGDGFLATSGFDTVSDLAIDPRDGDLYLAENDFFGGGTNRLWRTRQLRASSTLLYEGSGGSNLSQLRFVPGPSHATFDWFQPRSGGTLYFTQNDFFSSFTRHGLEPLRPTLTASGPGVSGPGSVQLEFQGLHPGGTLLFVLGPQSLYDPTEPPRLFQGFPPLFWGLDDATLKYFKFVMFADDAGKLSFNFFNPGDFHGQLAFQGVVGNADAYTLGTTAPLAF